MDLFSVTTVLLVILITSLLAKYTKVLLERSKLPPGPTPLPIIGTLYKININNIVKSLMDLSKTYGDIFTIYEGSQPVIVLCSYKAIKETLIDKAEEFSGRAYYASFSDYTKGDELAFGNGELWKELRRFSLLTFGSFGVGKQSFEERIREEALFLTDVLKKTNGSPMDPHSAFLRSVSNVICSVMFGKRFEYQDKDFQELVRGLEDNFKLMSSPWGILYNVYPNLMTYIPGPHHKIMKNFDFETDFIKKRIENNMKTLDHHNPRDYIDCFLIQMEKAQNRKDKTIIYTHNSLVMNSLVLLFGGTDSTSSTLKYIFLFLMKHPNIAEKVYNEVDNVIGQRPPNYEDRHNMPYTQAFIHEVQRYADVVPLALPHELTMDTELRNYNFKKGTAFYPVLTSAHTDKTQFSNPDHFDLKNFLDENGKFMKKAALVPFAAGKRICPGKSLAMMELFIFTTTLLQNFKIKSLVPPEKISVAPIGVGLAHIPPPCEICLLPRTCSQE